MTKLTVLFAIACAGAMVGYVATARHQAATDIPPQVLAGLAKEAAELAKAADCAEPKHPVAGATFQWPACNLEQGA